MLHVLRKGLERFRGFGDAAVTVPSMDGALRPNVRIENGKRLCEMPEPDNLIAHGGHILFSTGADLMELGPSAPKLVETLSSDITFLAAHPAGTLAIGLAEGKIVFRGPGKDGYELTELGGRRIVAATAGAFDADGSLLVCLGSQVFSTADWKHDLMSNKTTGSVWRIDVATAKAELLADTMAFPYGVAVGREGDVIVSESWRHRLVQIRPGAKPFPLYTDMPGYPSRLVADPGDKSLWLCVFAPRLQLIEFVLREDEYRRRMMDEVDSEYWIAPSLHRARSFLEPLQGGAVKQLGELKPWAPSRSYGLVVRLDEDCKAIESVHSRADGTLHGITSCLPQGGAVLVASKGGDAIVAVER